MSRDFPEPDWKILRELSKVALDRYCGRVLTDIAAISDDASRSRHERYGRIYELVRNRDRALAKIFDGLTRSTAFFHLTMIADLDLLTDEEMSRFSEDTREGIQDWLEVTRNR